MLKTKKAFTLVEIVIVIAVIGILASVLIPTFSGVIKNSRRNSDMQTIKNINQVIFTESFSPTNSKSMNVDRCVEAIEKSYSKSVLIASSDDHKIVYDSSTNYFALVKKGNLDNLVVTYADNNVELSSKKENIWFFTDNLDDVINNEYGYSYYLLDGAITGNMTLQTKSGLSLGKNDKYVVNVTYSSNDEKNVTLITNNGKLVIDAPNSIVNHYGYSSSIDSIKAKQYIEHGEISDITLDKGIIKIDSDAFVNTVRLGEYYSDVGIELEGIVHQPLNTTIDSLILDSILKVGTSAKNGVEEHNFDIINKRVEPTCIQDGYIIYQCICGEKSEKVSIPQTDNHSWDSNDECEHCGVKKYEITSEENLKSSIELINSNLYLIFKNIVNTNCGISTKSSTTIVLNLNKKTWNWNYNSTSIINGNVTIKNGKITKFNKVVNNGTLILDNVEFSDFSIVNKGTLIIRNGTKINCYEDTSTITLNSGNLSIENATISYTGEDASTIKVDSTNLVKINLSSAEIKSSTTAIEVIGKSNLEISGGGKIDGKYDLYATYDTIDNPNYPTVTINGGTYSNKIYFCPTPNGILTINGGTFSDNYNLIGGKIYINGGLFNNSIVKLSQTGTEVYTENGSLISTLQIISNYITTTTVESGYTKYVLSNLDEQYAVAKLYTESDSYYCEEMDIVINDIESGSITKVELLKDIEGEYTFKRSLVLNLNGHKMNSVIISGSSTNITIEDLSDNKTGLISLLTIDFTSYSIKLKIESGNYTKIRCLSNIPRDCVASCELNINGGYIEELVNDIDLEDETKCPCIVKITGGVFKFNPENILNPCDDTNCVLDGYVCAEEDGNGNYEVASGDIDIGED